MTHSLHIGAEAVKTSVDKILASQTFSRSEKLRCFLAYVVAREQSGAAHALKGYSIGVDVFGRPEEFDPTSDPLVRVQAGKLRKLLDRYYESEGVNDFVRVTIPRGGYVPHYQLNHHECPAPPSVLDIMPVVAQAQPQPRPAPKRARNRHGKRLFVAAAVTVNFVLAAVNIGVLRPDLPARAAISPPPTGSTRLPRLMIGSSEDGEAARSVSRTIHAVAGREAAVEVVSSADIPQGEADQRLTFHLDIKTGFAGGSLELSLTHAPSGDVVYRASYDSLENAPPARLNAIAMDLVSAILPVSGEIYRFALTKGISSELMQCMSMTELYNSTNARLAYINARACQSRLAPTIQPDNLYSSLHMLRDASRGMLRHPGV